MMSRKIQILKLIASLLIGLSISFFIGLVPLLPNNQLWS